MTVSGSLGGGKGRVQGEGVGGGGEGGEGERAGRMIQNIFPLPGATYTGVAKAPTGSHLAFAMRRLQRRWLRLSRALTGSHLASPEAAGEAAGFFMVVGVL